MGQEGQNSLWPYGLAIVVYRFFFLSFHFNQSKKLNVRGLPTLKQQGIVRQYDTVQHECCFI